MIFYLQGHERLNPVLQLLICLLPDEEHVRGEDPARPRGEYVVSALERKGDRLVAAAYDYRGGRVALECPAAMGEDDHELSEWLRRALYLLLAPYLPARPEWGMLTGVKPSKLALNMLNAGLTPEEAGERLERDFFVSPRRRELCMKTALVSQKFRDEREHGDVELYVGIPFCPAKCSYCSFVSNDVRSRGHLVEPYLETLFYEIAGLGRVLREADRHIRTIYIGGGTPSILSETQLERLLAGLERDLDLSRLLEYTWEAGRPETITREKLRIARAHGIGRISINPQTMNDEVLRGVGRLHTAQDVIDCYRMARETADFRINMDLIAGLPGDSEESLLHSVRSVAELGPDDLTLHALALKKGAPLRFGKTGELRAETMDACHDIIYAHGYEPYYLYRQKYSAGGLENVGFARGGRFCRYNVIMMEETGHVAALGSGGVTKLTYRDGSIVRITNAKYPIDYIGRTDLLDRNLSRLREALERD